jgi:hypothetical protein
MADFLLSLADFDRRRLWVELGHPSLFSFLRRELGLSAGAAQLRKTAAELLQKLPVLEGPLRDGRLCLSTVSALADVLTAENRAEVLPRFFGLSKREAEALAVSIQPAAAPHREIVTAVRTAPSAVQPGETESARAGAVPAPPAPPISAIPASATPAPATPAPGISASAISASASLSFHPGETTPAPAGAGPAATPPSRSPPPAQRPLVEPLTADLRRLHLTVSQRLLDKLEAARMVLSHARPGASAAEVMEAALDLLLEKHAMRRGLVKNPRSTQRPSMPGRVPAHVKRTVWKRDQGRCQWPLDSGGVCGSTLRVELDHVKPKARGGPPTVANLRLLCAFHNELAARLAFGDEWMDRYGRRRGPDRGPRDARPPLAVSPVAGPREDGPPDARPREHRPPDAGPHEDGPPAG